MGVGNGLFRVCVIAVFVFAVNGMSWSQPALAEKPRTIDVLLKDNKLPPGVINVFPGDRIIFRNVDDHSHTASVVEPSERFLEKEIEAGTSAMFVVPMGMPPGEYELNCTTHEDMKTTIVVDSRE